jgi:hypothetical protein
LQNFDIKSIYKLIFRKKIKKNQIEENRRQKRKYADTVKLDRQSVKHVNFIRIKYQ